jgi:hypothetical protein
MVHDGFNAVMHHSCSNKKIIDETPGVDNKKIGSAGNRPVFDLCYRKRNKNSTPIGVDIKGTVGFLKRIDQPFPFTCANRAICTLLVTDRPSSVEIYAPVRWHGHCECNRVKVTAKMAQLQK